MGRLSVCFLLPVVLLQGAWLSGCQVCGIGVAAAERDVLDCTGLVWDNLSRSYRITRHLDGVPTERSATLDISKKCGVKVTGHGIRDLEIASISVRRPRSNTGAMFLLKTKLENADGEPVTCTAPISEFDPMEFLCPYDRGELRYELAPED